MVVGESRYFTLRPVGGGSLAGYSATYEIKDVNGDVVKVGDVPVLNDGTDYFDVKIQTADMEHGVYKLAVLMEAVDGFIQAYYESITLS